MLREINRTWFEVWGQEQAQNRILKGLLLAFVMITIAQTAGIVALALRKPVLIGISQETSAVLKVTPPSTEILEAEKRRAVSGYLQSHYNWDWDKIAASITEAAKYVHPDFVKRFNEANAEQIKIAKEKRVSQRFYISKLIPDPKIKRIHVEGERILIVEGLRATSALMLDIDYDLGPRSESNPEGIFITGERNVGNSKL